MDLHESLNTYVSGNLFKKGWGLGIHFYKPKQEIKLLNSNPVILYQKKKMMG